MKLPCLQQTSYLEGGPLIRMPLYLHVNQKSDDDDDAAVTLWGEWHKKLECQMKQRFIDMYMSFSNQPGNKKNSKLTVSRHAHSQTLFKSTILASVPVQPNDHTLSIS